MFKNRPKCTFPEMCMKYLSKFRIIDKEIRYKGGGRGEGGLATSDLILTKMFIARAPRVQ